MALYAVVTIVFFFFLQLPVMAVTLSGDFSIWLAQKVWSPSALWLCGVDVEVTGHELLPPGPALYASNHESTLDIWLLFRFIPRNVRYVAKQELFRIPLFGWYLTLARFVPVDRGNQAKAVRALRRAAQLVRGGISLVVFPEGTRTADGRVQPFKKGPFVLAIEAGVPVVPVAIVGAAAVTPKRRMEVHPGKIRVAFGAPVDPASFADRTALLREVRRRIIELHRGLGGLGGVGDDVAARGVEGSGDA